MKAMITSVIAALFALLATQAMADDSLNCNASLQKTEVYRSQSVFLQLALLSLVDRTTYESLKKNVDATVIFDPGMISGNYDELQQRLTTYKSLYIINLAESSSDAYLASYIPNALAANWLKCKEMEASNTIGFHVLIEKATDNQITVYYVWVAPAEFAHKLAKMDSFSIGGVSGKYTTLPSRWRSGDKRYVTYARKTATDPFNVEVSVGGDGQHADYDFPISPPHIDKIDMACGSIQSLAIAAAVENGQAAGRSGPDMAWRNLPVPSLRTAQTNSNRAGSAVEVYATCDSTPSSAVAMTKNIVLSSLTYASGGDGEWHAWARWAPIWKSTLKLPVNGKATPYNIVVYYDDAISNPDRIPNCVFTVNGAPSAIPLNSRNDLRLSLAPGDYILKLECDRPEVTMFNETISMTFNVQRDTAVAAVPMTASPTFAVAQRRVAPMLWLRPIGK